MEETPSSACKRGDFLRPEALNIEQLEQCVRELGLELLVELQLRPVVAISCSLSRRASPRPLMPASWFSAASFMMSPLKLSTISAPVR
jgi:hypothetical protein